MPHFICRETCMLGSVNYLNPLDVRQYLFCLLPTSELRQDSYKLKEVTNIGKLDITWRTNMGEKGRLQTSPLQRMVCIFISKIRIL